MGKIELDHTGSGGGITLSSDGTDLLLDGTAIGGGGGTALELYAENPSSPTAPSATGAEAVAIGTGSVSSGNNTFAIGPQTGSTGTASTAIGYTAQSVGSFSTSVGRSYASGTDSFAAAIANNTSSYGATGNSSLALGKWTKSTGGSSVSIGYLVTSSGFGSIALGVTCEASQKYSVAFGARASSEVIGKLAFSSGQFSSTGDSQTGTFVLRRDTTDATAENLTTDLLTAGTTNQIILPNNSAYAFHGTIVARQQASAGTACAAWKVEGLIRREGSAGTTVLVNSATTVLDNTPAWGMALSADTTNGGLKIEVTGAAATNIRFVSTINTSEVTY